MKNLQIIARFQIQDGQQDAFKALSKTCIQTVKEKDTSTLRYDWFYNTGETECAVFETYKDSNGLLEHMGNVGDYLGQLMAISAFSGEIYDDTSDQLKAALNGLDVTYYDFNAGL